MQGRPPKSVADLKLHGNYRDDRHGSRADIESSVSGVPVKPDGLTKDEEWLWDLVVSEFGDDGPVRRLDTAALWQACKLWGLLVSAEKMAATDPLDKDYRIAVTSYYTAWDRAAAKLGITPRDRRSVSGGTPKSKPTGVRRRDRA